MLLKKPARAPSSAIAQRRRAHAPGFDATRCVRREKNQQPVDACVDARRAKRTAALGGDVTLSRICAAVAEFVSAACAAGEAVVVVAVVVVVVVCRRRLSSASSLSPSRCRAPVMRAAARWPQRLLVAGYLHGAVDATGRPLTDVSVALVRAFWRRRRRRR